MREVKAVVLPNLLKSWFIATDKSTQIEIGQLHQALHFFFEENKFPHHHPYWPQVQQALRQAQQKAEKDPSSLNFKVWVLWLYVASNPEYYGDNQASGDVGILNRSYAAFRRKWGEDPFYSNSFTLQDGQIQHYLENPYTVSSFSRCWSFFCCQARFDRDGELDLAIQAIQAKHGQQRAQTGGAVDAKARLEKRLNAATGQGYDTESQPLLTAKQ